MYDTSFMVSSVIHTDRVKNRRLWVREHCLNFWKSENHYRLDSRQSRTHFQERKMNLRYISFKTTEPVGRIRKGGKGNGNNSLMVFLVATCQNFGVGFYFYFENSTKTQYSSKKKSCAFATTHHKERTRVNIDWRRCCSCYLAPSLHVIRTINKKSTRGQTSYPGSTVSFPKSSLDVIFMSGSRLGEPERGQAAVNRVLI